MRSPGPLPRPALAGAAAAQEFCDQITTASTEVEGPLGAASRTG